MKRFAKRLAVRLGAIGPTAVAALVVVVLLPAAALAAAGVAHVAPEGAGPVSFDAAAPRDAGSSTDPLVLPPSGAQVIQGAPEKDGTGSEGEALKPGATQDKDQAGGAVGKGEEGSSKKDESSAPSDDDRQQVSNPSGQKDPLSADPQGPSGQTLIDGTPQASPSENSDKEAAPALHPAASLLSEELLAEPRVDTAFQWVTSTEGMAQGECAIVSYQGTPPTGGVTVPDTIDGLKVVKIGGGQPGSGPTPVPSSPYSRLKGTVDMSGARYLTKIDGWAFVNCFSLSGVKFPSGLQEIGQAAFRGDMRIGGTLSIPAGTIAQDAFKKCSSISGLDLTNTQTIGDSAFYECTALSGPLNLPEVLSSLGTSAFYGCSGISGNLALPSSLVGVPESAFAGCSAITSLTVPDSVKSFGRDAFKSCLLLGGSLSAAQVSSVGTSAFSSCRFSSIDLPAATSLGALAFKSNVNMINANISKVQTIGDSAFENCLSLVSMSIPGQTGGLDLPEATSIGDRAFFQCNKLSGALDIPKVTTIGANAFESCYTLKGIKSSPALQTIKTEAFLTCTALTDLPSLPSVTTIGDRAFSGVGPSLSADLYLPNAISIGTEAFVNASKLKSLTGTTKLQTIGDSAFEGCSGMAGALELPSATSIGTRAFYGDSSLTGSLSLPKLTMVKGSAFQGCSGFSGSLSLPLAQSIEDQAFQNCSGFKGILGLPAAQSIGTNAFYACSGFTGSLSLPEALNIAYAAFYSCSGFTALDLPKATGIGESAFNSCSGLAGKLDLPAIQAIGPYAFAQCGFDASDFGMGLSFVGEQAFRENHMVDLTLPENEALDLPYNAAAKQGVGPNIMIAQTISNRVNYYPDTTVGTIDVRGIATILDINFDSIGSLALSAPGAADVYPIDNSWIQTGSAQFNLSDLRRDDGRLHYGYNVNRVGSTKALSTGSVALPLNREAKYHFRAYYGSVGSDRHDDWVQWVLKNTTPQESYEGHDNYGFDAPGYHSGPTWGSGDGTAGAGAQVRPSDQVAEANADYYFNTVWTGNSFSVKFDEDVSRMQGLDPGLAQTNPDGSLTYVYGTPPGAMTGLAYGTPSAELPLNDFTMGGYRFAGWGPDMALVKAMVEADPGHYPGGFVENDWLIPGSTLFQQGEAVSEPTWVDVGGVLKRAPDQGDTITLHARWEATDLSAPDQITAAIIVPSSVQMQWDGPYLWSKGADAADPHAVEVKTSDMNAPGYLWPRNGGPSYLVSVVRPATDQPLLALSCDSDPGAPRAVDVLSKPDGAPYDPGVGTLPDPLISLRPYATGVFTAVSGDFYLRSQDKAADFLQNVLYEGTLTFRIDRVDPQAP